MANIRVKDLPNTNTAADTDEFIIDSSTAGTRRLSYSELKSEISTDFAADVATYGIATLDSDNKLTASQIPDSLAQGMNFVGVANSASDLTSTTQGDFYVIQTAFGSYNVGDQAVYDGSAYVRVVDGTKEISEGGTGATTLDAAKTNLEIINVGTGPSQVPLNQHLGTMAYQDIAGVSAAKLEVESTTGTATTEAFKVTDGTDTNFVVQEDGKTGIGTSSPSAVTEITGAGTGGRGLKITETSTSKTSGVYTFEVDSSAHGSNMSAAGAMKIDVASGRALTVDGQGRVGIGTSSPGSYYTGTDDLVVAGASGDRGITIATANTANGGLMFADSDSTTIGRIQYSHGTNEMKFRVNNTEVWSINASGNLVANGTAIDFGSGATTTLDTYEEGFHTATLTPASSGTMTLGTGADTLAYTRIGRTVTITGRLQLSSVSSPVGDYFKISLPTGIGVGNLTDAAGSLTGSCFVFNAAGNSGDYSVLGLEGDAFLRVYKNTNPSATATAADFSGDESIYLGVTYITA